MEVRLRQHVLVMWKRLSRLWKPSEREPNDKCPVCGRPVVAAPDRMLSPLGAMLVARTKEELTAACIVDGRPPSNDDTRR